MIGSCVAALTVEVAFGCDAGNQKGRNVFAPIFKFFSMVYIPFLRIHSLKYLYFLLLSVILGESISDGSFSPLLNVNFHIFYA